MDELHKENEKESYFKDHVFDFSNKFHPCQQKCKDTITSGSSLLKGVTGLRSTYYKLNEAKLLPEHKANLSLKPFPTDK